MIKLTLLGIYEARAANEKRMAALQPSGAVGQAVRDMTMKMHRYAVQITHVDTSALQKSHRMGFTESSDMVIGEIYIAGDSQNPRTGQLTAVYGPMEQARGGSHAFYTRTVYEFGEQAKSEFATFMGLYLYRT